LEETVTDDMKKGQVKVLSPLTVLYSSIIVIEKQARRNCDLLFITKGEG